MFRVMFDLKAFEEVIQQFNSLPRDTSSTTFMQIAGYPHYENVCSNILAFYLDPEGEHELRDLLLQAFFRALKVADMGRIPSAKITREESTDTRKRLDLLINAPTFVMGIENKIWADLYNDLGEYAALIERQIKGMDNSRRAIYRVVLSLMRIEAECLPHGFVSITHGDWIAQARNLLGHYATGANPKFLTYFIDFMANLESLTETPMNDERIKFFVQNGHQLAEISSEYEKFLGQQLSNLRSLIKTLPATTCRQWVWEKYTLVHDILPKGQPDKRLSVDAAWSPDGWYIELFCRGCDGSTKSGCAVYLNESLGKLPTEAGEGFKTEGRGMIRTFAAGTPASEVAGCVNSLLSALYKIAGYPG